jgi:hypothetical protein
MTAPIVTIIGILIAVLATVGVPFCVLLIVHERKRQREGDPERSRA